MTEIGLVVEADEKTAKIRIPRTSACGGNCSGCGAECEKSGFYTVDNLHKLEVGDRVKLNITSGQFALNMLLGYGILILALLGGILLGYFLFNSDGKAILTGLIVFFAAIILQRLFFKNRKQKIKVEKL